MLHFRGSRLKTAGIPKEPITFCWNSIGFPVFSGGGVLGLRLGSALQFSLGERASPYAGFSRFTLVLYIEVST